MAKYDPELRAHRDWLGLLQPAGLVVSPPALVRAQAVPSQNVAELQQQFLSVVEHPPGSQSVTDEPALTNLPAFFQTVLGWSLDDIAGASGGPPLPDGLELVLPDFNETLRPTYVAVDSMGDGGPLMLVQAVARDTELDETPQDDGRTAWFASPQAKLERFLREVKVPAGLLCNGDAVRVVYAPSGESSGHLTFPVAAMCEVSGRPILAALDMLLSEHRVFSAPDGRRLGDILSESRRYQAEVSNTLSDQVLGALWELLRGFQASDPEDGRRNFDETAREDPQHVYGGQLAVLMRLIFVLYAEDEGLMPEGDVYATTTTRSRVSTTDSGQMPAATRTRWTSGTAPTRGCYPSSDSSSTAVATLACGSRPATASSSIPTSFRFLKAGLGASGGSLARSLRRRRSRMAASTECCTLSWCSTASGSPIERSTWSRSARSTRR